MKLGLSRVVVIRSFFILVSLSSAVYVSLGAANYLTFFPALAALNSQVTKVAFLGGPPGPRFSASVVVENPGDYSGFTVGDLSLVVFLESGNASAPGSFGQRLFADQPLSSVLRLDRDLGPHSQATADMIFDLNQQKYASFSSFNQTYHGQVFVHTFLTVDIITFLLKLTGTTVLNPVQDVPLK